MIVVKLCGGLGNQLYQYAFAKHLALKYQSKLKLDVSWYIGSVEQKRYELNRKFEIANFNLHFNGFYQANSFKGKMLHKLFGLRTIPEKIFEGDNYDYATEAGDNIILDGYWGSYSQYLFDKDFNRLIKKEFTIKPGLFNEKHRMFAEQIERSENPVALLVRRGDYHHLPLFGMLGTDYYKRATEKISACVSNPEYFIFSDEFDWVIENFDFLQNKTFVDAKHVISNFHLMTLCKHNIIANSSYGWWGAFLGTNENKVVIAPKVWFLLDEKAQDFHEKSKCMPASWIRL